MLPVRRLIKNTPSEEGKHRTQPVCFKWYTVAIGIWIGYEFFSLTHRLRRTSDRRNMGVVECWGHRTGSPRSLGAGCRTTWTAPVPPYRTAPSIPPTSTSFAIRRRPLLKVSMKHVKQPRDPTSNRVESERNWHKNVRWRDMFLWRHLLLFAAISFKHVWFRTAQVRLFWLHMMQRGHDIRTAFQPLRTGWHT